MNADASAFCISLTQNAVCVFFLVVILRVQFFNEMPEQRKKAVQAKREGKIRPVCNIFPECTEHTRKKKLACGDFFGFVYPSGFEAFT